MAGWTDYGRLLRIAADAQFRMLARQPSLGWFTFALIGVLVAEAFWLADLIGTRTPLVVLPSVVVGGCVVFLLGRTAYRVIDPRRLVLLSLTRGAVVDLRFSPDSHPARGRAARSGLALGRLSRGALHCRAGSHHPGPRTSGTPSAIRTSHPDLPSVR